MVLFHILVEETLRFKCCIVFMIFLQADSPPPDSGLADTLDTDQVTLSLMFNTTSRMLQLLQVATDNNVTPSSDTMEDLSLQVLETSQFMDFFMW